MTWPWAHPRTLHQWNISHHLGHLDEPILHGELCILHELLTELWSRPLCFGDQLSFPCIHTMLIFLPWAHPISICELDLFTLLRNSVSFSTFFYAMFVLAELPSCSNPSSPHALIFDPTLLKHLIIPKMTRHDGLLWLSSLSISASYSVPLLRIPTPINNSTELLSTSAPMHSH